MKAFVIFCAIVAVVSASAKVEDRKKRNLFHDTTSDWGNGGQYGYYGTGQNGYLSGNNLYGSDFGSSKSGWGLGSGLGSGWESSKSGWGLGSGLGSGWESSKSGWGPGSGLGSGWGSNYASNYGFDQNFGNKGYFYPATLNRYSYSAPSSEYAVIRPSTGYSYSTSSNDYKNYAPSIGYTNTYSVPAKIYSFSQPQSGPSISVVPSVGYSLPSAKYIQYPTVQQPTHQVIEVRKVVNVQREVLVPQVVQVKKIITEPKVITEKQVVPVITTYPSGHGSGFSNTYASSSSGNSEISYPSSGSSNAVSSGSSNVVSSSSSLPSGSSSAYSSGPTDWNSGVSSSSSVTSSGSSAVANSGTW